METLRGTLREFLKKPEEGKPSGFALALYETSTGLAPVKIGGPFTTNMRVGDWFVAKGSWKEGFFRGKKEQTFKAFALRPDMPTTIEGAKELLLRTFNVDEHGIDSAAVEKILKDFGPDVMRHLERNPRLLLDYSTPSGTYIRAILRDWGRRTSGRAAVALMDEAKFSSRAVEYVLDAFRDDALKTIRSDPFRLVGMSDITFDQADNIAGQIGITPDDPRRVKAAVAAAITDAVDGGGHTYTSFSEMTDTLRGRGIEAPAIRNAIQDRDIGSSVSFDVMGDTSIVQHAALARGERSIAHDITRMLAREMPPERSEHIGRVARHILSTNIEFAQFDEIQRAAVETVSRENFGILTGGPGTGKTTVTKAITMIAEATSDGPLILVSPTGKASYRLSDATQREAMTVHTALLATFEEGRFVFARNRDNPFPRGCFVVVDEASMLDVETAAALLDAMPEDGRLLLVGDPHQLPSVGAGSVLRDLLDARAANGMRVPAAELINVYRSARNSSIATGAKLIKDGEIPYLDNRVRGGLILYEHKTPEILNRISAVIRGPVTTKLGLDPMKDVGILTPQAPGPAGTWELNTRMSAELNPHGARIEGVGHAAHDDAKMPLPRVGDRVMLTKNDKENKVMNGEVGTLVEAYSGAKGGNGGRMLKVIFDSGREVDFPLSRWRDLIPAYAITGHKSQGSQYPLVIMPLTMRHSRMLERTLVYTEWTRAQDYLLLVGEREALEFAVQTVTSSKRRTRLRQHLEASLDTLTPKPVVEEPRRQAPRGLRRSTPRPAAEPQGYSPSP